MKKIIILSILLGFSLSSCTRDNVNEDQHATYDAIPESLVTYAEKELSDFLNTPNVNENNFRLTMQYWQETTYVNESNYDFSKNHYMKQAYDTKKWGFVPDYARLDIVYQYGGIYLDTDVELRKKLDGFLTQSAFTGFESKGLPFTALWAAEKGHLLSKKVMNYYEAKTYTLGQQTNTNIVSDVVSAFSTNHQTTRV